MTEAELKAAVKRIARLNGWITHEAAQNRIVRPVKGESTGYPDLTCARDGEVVFIELKTDTGVHSMEQRIWQQALPACHVIRPRDLASGRVNELLG